MGEEECMYTAQGDVKCIERFVMNDYVPFEHVNGDCIHPYGGARVPPNGTHAVLFPDCGSEDRMLFRFKSVFENSGAIQHKSSGKCLYPENGRTQDGTKLVLWEGCDDERARFRIRPSGALQHVSSGKCVQPIDVWAIKVNTPLVLREGCEFLDGRTNTGPMQSHGSGRRKKNRRRRR